MAMKGSDYKLQTPVAEKHDVSKIMQNPQNHQCHKIRYIEFGTIPECFHLSSRIGSLQIFLLPYGWYVRISFL